MPKSTTINGQTHLQILQKKLPTHMNILNCSYFRHDGAPCHRTSAVSLWLRQQNIRVPGPWPGSSPDLNPMKNLWVLLKEKVAQECPTSKQTSTAAIKRVWTQHITQAYCAALASSMPTHKKRYLRTKDSIQSTKNV